MPAAISSRETRGRIRREDQVPDPHKRAESEERHLVQMLCFWLDPDERFSPSLRGLTCPMISIMYGDFEACLNHIVAFLKKTVSTQKMGNSQVDRVCGLDSAQIGNTARDGLCLFADVCENPRRNLNSRVLGRICGPLMVSIDSLLIENERTVDDHIIEALVSLSMSNPKQVLRVLALDQSVPSAKPNVSILLEQKTVRSRIRMLVIHSMLKELDQEYISANQLRCPVGNVTLPLNGNIVPSRLFKLSRVGEESTID